jgi:fluoroacetyl-CoA thioesterase
MDLNDIFQQGLSKEEIFQVEEEHAAIHVGSGSSRVLATPWMIAFMERVSHRLMAEHLPAGYTSVGFLVNVRHLAPTPIGTSIRVMTQVKEITGRRVLFEVSAWDQTEQIGTGEHQRAVVEEGRFLSRAAEKSSQDKIDLEK